MRVLNLGGYSGFGYDDCWGKPIEFDRSVFPDGSVFFRLKDPGVRGMGVTILARLTSGTGIMELLVAVDALRRAGYGDLDLVMPYVPYAQQDSVHSPGESLSLEVFAGIVKGLQFRSVRVFDPHSKVTPALMGRRCTVVDNRSLVQKALSCVGDGEDRVNVICPDDGAQKKIGALIPRLVWGDRKYALYCCEKIRDLPTNKIVGTYIPKIEGLDAPCLIVDDICLAGGTFLGIVAEMRKQGYTGDVYLCVSHGLFNARQDELEKAFVRIFTTDSWPANPLFPDPVNVTRFSVLGYMR